MDVSNDEASFYRRLTMQEAKPLCVNINDVGAQADDNVHFPSTHRTLKWHMTSGICCQENPNSPII